MNNFEFYINKYYFIKTKKEVDVSSLSPIIRRRLGSLDKAVFTTISRVFENDIREIVYSSQKGESERLNAIIAQYEEFNEVSPAQFSASVHNFPVGFFTLYNKLNIPYYAIASGKNSLSAGIIKSVIAKNKPVLFCYADFDIEPSSVACVISWEKNISAMKCILTPDDCEIENEFSNFTDFLEGKSGVFQGGLCKIERVE